MFTLKMDKYPSTALAGARPEFKKTLSLRGGPIMDQDSSATDDDSNNRPGGGVTTLHMNF